MSNLIKKDLSLESREVAEMVGKEHSELLKDIRRYSEYLAEGDFHLGDFFSESVYLDKNNQERPCYKVTKKGCEFIAHKLTGQKGTLFTATYINRFHELETSLNQAITMLTEEQKLQLAIFQARTIDEAGMAAANLDRYRQKQLEDKQKELEYKAEVIKGITEDIDIYTKRNVLNKVVRYKKANYSQRWNELYQRFKEVYSVDLIDNLYKVALKLYETDIREILEQLKE